MRIKEEEVAEFSISCGNIDDVGLNYLGQSLKKLANLQNLELRFDL